MYAKAFKERERERERERGERERDLYLDRNTFELHTCVSVHVFS